MAFDLQKMTVDYKQLLRMVPTQRQQLAQSGAVNDLISALTPGQLVSLFPRYYRQTLPDVGQINKYASSLDVALSNVPSRGRSDTGGTYTSTGTSYGGPSPSPGMKTTITPEQQAVQDLIQEAGVFAGSEKTSAVTDKKNRVISTASTNLSPQERALLDTIAMGDATSGERYWESPDYNTIVGGDKFESYQDHPRVFGTATSTAAGRYQFTKSTWDDVITRYNKRYPDDKITDFSPLNQDKAALFLARERYKANTGRDLDTDLANPPDNFGSLIKSGLGFAGEGSFLTWEAFIKKNEEEIKKAFDSNYERNIGYVEEIEKAAEKVENLETALVKFEPSMLEQMDKRYQQWYENANENQKRLFEKAVEKLGVERFNERMKEVPLNSATLQATTATPMEGAPLMLPVGGSMAGKSIVSDEDVPFSGGSYGSRSFGGPRGKNQLHTGVDIPGKVGDPVLAVDNGTIVDMRKSPSGYGYTMDVKYSDGTIHRMAHLGTNDGGWNSAFAKELKIGDTITAGQQIGSMGYSGNAGADFPHVHYEVINPEYYEKYKGRPPGRISGRTEESFEELKEGRIDPREWYAKRQQEYAEQQKQKIKTEAEGIAASSPVTATQHQLQTQKQEISPEASSNATSVAPPTSNVAVPALATGGLKNVPPGENIVGINTTTGQPEFFANDRENIRVEPGTLENKARMPEITREDVERLEAPNQPLQQRAPKPMTKDDTDPYMFSTMTGEYPPVSPSSMRASNRARLYNEDSFGLVNGHFA